MHEDPEHQGPKAKNPNSLELGFCTWWWYRDLNLGHQHYECCALTS